MIEFGVMDVGGDGGLGVIEVGGDGGWVMEVRLWRLG